MHSSWKSTWKYTRQPLVVLSARNPNLLRVETHITQTDLTMTALLATRDIQALLLRIEMLKFTIRWQIGKQFAIDPFLLLAFSAQLKRVDRTQGFWYLSSLLFVCLFYRFGFFFSINYALGIFHVDTSWNQRATCAHKCSRSLGANATHSQCMGTEHHTLTMHGHLW